MQENNQKESLPTEGVTPVPVEPNLETVPDTVSTTTTSEAVVAQTVSSVPDAKSSALSPVVKKYLLALLAVVVISGGLLFVLEKQGRISTGLFSSVMSEPAARVNGEEIKRADYDSSVAQLLQIAESKGENTADPVVTAQYETQAIDTLVNGELLRQAALAAGKEAPVEAVDARLAEIETGVGGPEQLTTRMGEFGITMETLRRDIENEILIQSLFEDVLSQDIEVVTDAQIETLYTELGGSEAGLPPLAEVSEQIAEQIRMNQQQAEVAEYLETLRVDADIEVLI